MHWLQVVTYNLNIEAAIAIYTHIVRCLINVNAFGISMAVWYTVFIHGFICHWKDSSNVEDNQCKGMVRVISYCAT